METFCILDSEWDCAICYAEASGSQVCVLSQDTDPLLIHQCRIRTFGSRRGFLVHQDCWEILKESLAEEKDQTRILRSLGRLAQSLSFLWPVPKAVRSARMRQIAVYAGHYYVHSVSRFTTESSLRKVLDQLQSLPVELELRILELSLPCDLLRFCTVWKVAAHLASSTDAIYSPRPLSTLGDIRAIRHKILDRDYVGDIEECVSRTPTGTIVMAYDNIGCKYVGHLTGADLGPARWYRFIPPEFQQGLLLYYKVGLELYICYSSLTSSRATTSRTF